MLCTALPALASTRFPRLYELSSFVRAALISMGSVLTANRTVDADPASIAMADMELTLRSRRLGARRVSYPSCRNLSWVNSRMAVVAAWTMTADSAFQAERGSFPRWVSGCETGPRRQAEFAAYVKVAG